MVLEGICSTCVTSLDGNHNKCGTFSSFQFCSHCCRSKLALSNAILTVLRSITDYKLLDCGRAHFLEHSSKNQEVICLHHCRVVFGLEISSGGSINHPLGGAGMLLYFKRALCAPASLLASLMTKARETATPCDVRPYRDPHTFS